MKDSPRREPTASEDRVDAAAPPHEEGKLPLQQQMGTSTLSGGIPLSEIQPSLDKTAEISRESGTDDVTKS